MSYSQGSGVGVRTNNSVPGQHQNILITGNVLHHNNQSNIGGDGGVFLYNVQTVNVSHNTIHHNGNGTASTVGVQLSTSAYRVNIQGNIIWNEGQGGGLGVGIQFGGANYVTAIGNQIFDDQSTRTMSFALNGFIGVQGTVAKNILGAMLGVSNNMTYAADTIVDQSIGSSARAFIVGPNAVVYPSAAFIASASVTGTLAMATTTSLEFLQNSAAVATLTVLLPVLTGIPNQPAEVASIGGITALTLQTSSGGTIAGAPTSIPANGRIRMISNGTTWLWAS